MNCEDITGLLAEGRPMDAAALEHVTSCAGCRNMLAALSETDPEVSATQLAMANSALTASLQPVTPLPSNAVLALFGLVFFLAFSMAAAMPFGLYAVHSLNLPQKIAYWGPLLVLAALFSLTTAEHIIPGAKRHANAVALSAGSVIVLAIVALALFPTNDMNAFLEDGIPCLRLGTISAIVCGLLATPLIRKGFLTTPLASVTVLGFFSGLAGFGALALHCPLQNAPHVLVWHLSVVLLGGLGGAALGRLWNRKVWNP